MTEAATIDREAVQDTPTPPSETARAMGYGQSPIELSPDRGSALAPEVRQRLLTPQKSPTIVTNTAQSPPAASPALEAARLQRERGENASRDPNARNPSSSAGGLNQIIDGTWLSLMNKHRPDLVQGKTRDQILAMKYDGALNNEMAAKYDEDNARILAANGIPPNPNFLNVMYRAGEGGGLAIIKTAMTNPNTLAGQVAPDLMKPGNGGAGNMTVGQFIAQPYGRGPGGDAVSGQQMYATAQGNQILASMAADSAQGRARLAKLEAGYKPVEIKDPPKAPDVNPMDTFGSLLGVFAQIAAGFSRTPAVAAMNSMASAITAAKESKWEDYKAHYQQWKDNTDLAFKTHDAYSRDVKTAMEMMTHNMAAGTAMLNATIALAGDDRAAKHMAQGDYIALQNHINQQDKTKQDMQTGAPKAFVAMQLDQALKLRQQAEQTHDPAQIAEAQANVDHWMGEMSKLSAAAYGSSRGAASAPQMVRTADGQEIPAIWDQATRQWLEPGSKTPLAGQERIVPLGKQGSVAKMSPEALRRVAERVLAGDTTALSGFGRSPALLTQIEDMIATVSAEKGMTGTDIARAKADFAALTKALKDFATGPQGKTAQALNVATQHLAMLGEAATALAQSDIQTLNRLQNVFKNEFGWEQPITFNAIRTIVGSEVEKAVAGSAGALEDRQQLREGLSSSATPGQIASVIEAYKGLMAGQLQGLEKTYERTTKRKDFREEFLLPESRKELERLAPITAASGAPTAPRSGPTEGATAISKSGRPIIFRNGNWEYAQ